MSWAVLIEIIANGQPHLPEVAPRLMWSICNFTKSLRWRTLIFIIEHISFARRVFRETRKQQCMWSATTVRRNTVYFGNDEHVELGRARVREWHNYCLSWLHRLPSRRASAQRVGDRRRSPPLVSWARAATQSFIDLSRSILTTYSCLCRKGNLRLFKSRFVLFDAALIVLVHTMKSSM